MTGSVRTGQGSLVSRPDIVLQDLAISVGCSVARLHGDIEGKSRVLGDIAETLTSPAWASAQDAIVAGGCHVVSEVARTASGNTEGGQRQPCSKECGGGRRFCDALASALIGGDAESARSCLDDFAERIRFSDSVRHDGILHFATYICLGFEEQALSHPDRDAT
jgi:hypothetical protein